MNVVLIPFFLAARVAIDTPWEHGPEYAFQVQVNSTAIPEEEPHGSMRLNVASRLICQPKKLYTLSCHFRDSKASSYISESLDPSGFAAPEYPMSPQLAYEINQDQFEIQFSEQGLESLLVSEDIQPRELDMIRVIVDQLNIGAIAGDKIDERFELMENFTQGECITSFTVHRKPLDRTLYTNRGYKLESGVRLKDGQLVQIQKTRHLYMCTHNIPYFFGNAEGIGQASDLLSAVTSSESTILITPTEFVSSTWNVVRTNKAIEAMVTTLYENITLRLESIHPAEGEPPEVREAERASIFIGRWLTDDSFEDDF